MILCTDHSRNNISGMVFKILRSGAESAEPALKAMFYIGMSIGRTDSGNLTLSFSMLVYRGNDHGAGSAATRIRPGKSGLSDKLSLVQRK
jgi:hypothetical protein